MRWHQLGQGFFYGPSTPVTAWEQAKPWMNFGLARSMRTAV